MVDAIHVMEAAVNNVATKKEENKNSSSLEGSLVSALKDVDDTFLQALDLLEDKNKAKIFIALTGNMKRQWFLSKLNVPAYYPCTLSD
ncbi:hypothetical protein MKX03_014079 [Papaver bracteatum]|nr:hypothetical protein MKX03_014079 [Papaver bracteatum]